MRSNFIKKGLPRALLVLLLVFGLVMLFQPGAKACVSGQGGDDFGFGNLLQSFFGGCPAPLAGTAVGSFLFVHDFDYSHPDSGPADSYSSFGYSWAHANTETGQINLVTVASGFFFDWSAGAIIDAYHLGEGVNPADVNVSIEYDGTLSPGSAFGIALFGQNGFQLFGKVAQGEYSGTWSVSLDEIAQVDESNSFCMGFAAFTLAWGDEASALFGKAEFGDTFQLSFVNNQGGGVSVNSDGGFSEVPIPGTIFLFVPGLIGIFAFRRKKS